MLVLVLNCGSSSLKYQLFDMTDQSVLAKGRVERIGIDGSFLIHEGKGDEIEIETDMSDHTVAIKNVLDILVNEEHGVIENFDQIEAVGHRVVHGGEDFSGSVLITNEVKDALTRNIELAPLHNPPNLMGIAAVEANIPGVPNVGVFDTAFHATMPQYAYLYGLPYKLYEKYRIRRYGFHGTSHKFVSERCAVLMDKPAEEIRIITAHLGNGSSIAAVDKGISVDTSMGFTPLEGVMMGTRTGDFDPAIVGYIMQKENLDFNGFNDLVNKQSGVFGISGVSSDMRDVESAASSGNELAALSLQMFEYKVRKYIGSYVAAMKGVDAIVFTAGIGENDVKLRKNILDNLAWLGIEIDDEINANHKIKEKELTKPGSKVRVFVIPTNEELGIANDTYEIVQNLK
ncbi:MAG: acetate kinase [Firmicutes bacterium]|nr:acetate kinase [Bacillota bacterium]